LWERGEYHGARVVSGSNAAGQLGARRVALAAAELARRLKKKRQLQAERERAAEAERAARSTAHSRSVPAWKWRASASWPRRWSVRGYWVNGRSPSARASRPALL